MLAYTLLDWPVCTDVRASGDECHDFQRSGLLYFNNGTVLCSCLIYSIHITAVLSPDALSMQGILGLTEPSGRHPTY